MPTRRLLLFAALLAVAPTLAHAQQPYPNHAVKVIVPFAPGGGADVLARIIGPRLHELWGQPVVVDNRPGSSGAVGAALLKQAEPDGYTLMLTGTGGVSLPPPDGAPPPTKPFDVAEHFVPIALAAAPPYIVVVHPSVPATSIAQLIAYAKANPGKVAFGSSGTGTASHSAGLMFATMTGTTLLAVPYKGIGQALTDLVSGQIAVMFCPPQSAVPHIQANALRALAVTSPNPSPFFPGVPPVSATVPGYAAEGWFGLFAPLKTPPAIVQQINLAVRKVLQRPEVKESLAALAAVPGDLSPEDWTRFVNADQAKWDKLLAGTPSQ
jgi:tripartite-type tricarboxylate transporter receptor subunit TctC